MTRTPLPCLALLSCGLLSTPSGWAGYQFNLDDLKIDATLGAGGAIVSTRGNNFGSGQVDLRSGANHGNRSTWQEFFLKPGMTLSYGLEPDLELLAGASAIGATTFGDGDAGGYTRSSDGRTAMEEAYAGLRVGDWRFTAGRQNFMVGSGFIVADGNLDMFKDGAFWLAPRTAFRDSALVRYAHDALQGQAFSLRTDDHAGDYRLNGVNLDYRLADRVTLGAMAMGVDALASRSENLAPRDGMRVYNVRALNGQLPGLDALTLHGEYAVQRGNGEGVQYHASAWYAQADYSFAQLPLTPLLSYRHARFSGDDDPNDNTRKSWDPLNKGFIDWSTWLIGDVVGNYVLINSNERVDQWTLKTHLSDTVTLGGIHYQFSLDQKNFNGMPVDDRRFADENVVFLDWNPTKSLHTSLAYNWVTPRGAARQTMGNDRFQALELYFLYTY
ncbi:alginate export family protein [Pseudomonas sp. zfem002]|uniref:alginate export family protein n=1 Tax=Pseudomonas sp. zfem002 TaxID=3078197 RepID=UPI0029299A02|nr:alginate export family protein [Pseudomonas sp. zfem002]MDU9392302.1 alginate export family protein [Pseudomonas sp. zfem002]